MTEFRAALEAIRDAEGKSGRTLRAMAGDALIEQARVQAEGREALAEQQRIDAETAASEDRRLCGIPDIQPERWIECGPGEPARWRISNSGEGAFVTDREKFDHGYCDGCFTAGLVVSQRTELVQPRILCDECFERVQTETDARVNAQCVELDAEAAAAADRAAKIARME
jgi:hypothetical protein